MKKEKFEYVCNDTVGAIGHIIEAVSITMSDKQYIKLLKEIKTEIDCLLEDAEEYLTKEDKI